MEYYGNKLCISAHELESGGIMTQAYCRQLASRNRISIARPGGGKGNYALIAVDSLPTSYRAKVEEVFPGGDEVRVSGWILSNYETDPAAVTFFNDRSLTGIDLTDKKKKEYIVNASVLNCCIKLYERARDSKKLFGETYNWDMMARTIETLRRELGHTLPASTLRFRKKVNEYRHEGYACLISGKFGNQSARKVDHKTEQLILGLAIQGNQPYAKQVYDMYSAFVCGELEVFDPETGELFNPDDFTDKKGDPKTLSEATIIYYLNKPKNKLLIEHKLRTWTSFMHEQAPHVHRHAPEFSLSKVSFDDRDLPRKLKDTKLRPKAYYAYDVASQCVIGVAYNRNKNVDIVVDCFRSMFRLLDRQGWGSPAQVEVENHLMSQWKESFLKAGVMFPFVRFCAPQNSQEKYAEPMNGAKKRSIEHRNHLGVGRFYGKGKWRIESKKISDELNDTYEDKEYYSWEQLIAEDTADVKEWNNALHPNQKKYKGMSRWDVLVANLNPTLQPISKAVLAKYIGEKVETSIRRNSYCRVDYKDWWLSKTSILEQLTPNNVNVEAYYIPDDNGKYSEVYIYQGDRYIDTLEDVGTFNTADAEQTEKDKEVFQAQQKKIAAFRKYINDNAIGHVGIIKDTSASIDEEDEELEIETKVANDEQQPPIILPVMDAGQRAVMDI